MGRPLGWAGHWDGQATDMVGYQDRLETRMGRPPKWAGHRDGQVYRDRQVHQDGRATGISRPPGKAGHWDQRATWMGGLPGWADHQEMGATEDWVGHLGMAGSHLSTSRATPGTPASSTYKKEN